MRAAARASCRARLRPAPARQHLPGDEEYVFKHNLEREALVRLTPAERAPLPPRHRRVARVPGELGRSEEYLEMLARHREKAGAARSRRRAYLRRATSRARATPTPRRPSYYAKGLRLLRGVRSADEDLRLPALHHHGDVLQSLGAQRRGARGLPSRCSRAPAGSICASKGGAAHSRIGRLYRETGRLEEAEPPPRRRRSRSSGRPGRARHRQHARRHRQAPLAQGRLPARARVHAAQPRHAPQARRPPQHRAVAQQPRPGPPGLGQLQGRARGLRAGAAHPARDRRSRSA